MAKRMSQAEFISRANRIHKGAYDYSKVVYKNTSTKVIIVCPKHGQFLTTPAVHLKSGCRKCAIEAQSSEYAKSSADFVSQSRQVHGDRYDYSKVAYKNKKTKVIIICPEHGEFEQVPSNHLMGAQCPVCARQKAAKKRSRPQGERKVVSTETFIKQARIVHGDLYDYSKVVYVNSRSRVTIVCPAHGEFEQRASNHLVGNKCKSCILEARSAQLSRGTEEFIRSAREVHNDEYDYRKTVYKSSRSKVVVTCPKHGDFTVVAGHHLRGVKCGRCMSDSSRASREEFIRKSQALHGNRYDYSKVDYKRNCDKVTIICPLHGEFEQEPRNHSSESCASGCPKCKTYSLWDPSKMTDEQKAMPCSTYAFFLEDLRTGESFLKVGISTGIQRRASDLRREGGYHVTCLSSVELSMVEAWDLEQEVHRLLAQYCYRPRNNFGGVTECFANSAIVELVEMGYFEFSELPIQLQSMVPSVLNLRAA